MSRWRQGCTWKYFEYNFVFLLKTTVIYICCIYRTSNSPKTDTDRGWFFLNLIFLNGFEIYVLWYRESFLSLARATLARACIAAASTSRLQECKATRVVQWQRSRRCTRRGAQRSAIFVNDNTMFTCWTAEYSRVAVNLGRLEFGLVDTMSKPYITETTRRLLSSSVQYGPYKTDDLKPRKRNFLIVLTRGTQ